MLLSRTPWHERVQIVLTMSLLPLTDKVTAWRYFRWLLFFWPATLKLKAMAGFSAAIVKALLAALVVLCLLLKSFLQPFYSVSMSLYVHLRVSTVELTGP